jgi:hypothetical protein
MLMFDKKYKNDKLIALRYYKIASIPVMQLLMQLIFRHEDQIVRINDHISSLARFFEQALDYRIESPLVM